MDEVTAESVESTEVASEQVSAPVEVEQVSASPVVAPIELVVTPQVPASPVVAPVEPVVAPVDVSATKSAFAAFVAAVEADIAKAHAFEVYEVSAIRSRLTAIKNILNRK